MGAMNNIYINTIIWCAIVSIICTTIFILWGVIPPWSNIYVAWILDLLIIYLASEHIKEIKKLPFCKSEDVVRIRHHRTITLELPLERVVDLVFQALEQEGDFKVKNKGSAREKIQGFFIYYHTLLKFKIPDLKLIRFEFLLKEIEDQKTECEASIWPTLFLATYDGGYNLEKLVSLISYLKTHASNL